MAGFWPTGAIQCPFFSPSGAIRATSTVAGNLTADRGCCALQISAKLPDSSAGNETARNLRPLQQTDITGPV